MRNILKLAFAAFLLTGCVAKIESDYIVEHNNEVEKYTSKYANELKELAGYIVEECTIKKLEAKTNVSLKNIGQYFLNGRVIYQLDNTGKIISALYENKGNIQRACVSKYATGYQLPSSNGLKYVYGQFHLNITGDKL